MAVTWRLRSDLVNDFSGLDPFAAGRAALPASDVLPCVMTLARACESGYCSPRTKVRPQWPIQSRKFCKPSRTANSSLSPTTTIARARAPHYRSLALYRREDGFIIRHTSGIVCAPITTEDARRLRLDRWSRTTNQSHHRLYGIDRLQADGGPHFGGRTRVVLPCAGEPQCRRQ